MNININYNYLIQLLIYNLKFTIKYKKFEYTTYKYLNSYYNLTKVKQNLLVEYNFVYYFKRL